MTAVTVPAAASLRRLYFVRFAFALVWALALLLTASGIGPVSATLLVLYPLLDAAAAFFDVTSSRDGGSARGLHVNIVISSLAGLGLIVAVTSGIPAVLRVWGVWAVVAGLVQLVVATRRRMLGGQWAMIASGSISAVAGIAFFLQAAGAHPSLKNVAGYAVLGGIFFLLSALRLGRSTDASLTP